MTADNLNPVRFVIVGSQRSGTTVTHLCLKGHPQVTCPSDEVYVDPLFSRGISTFTVGGDTYHERRRGLLGLFDVLAAGPEPKRDTRARGFKLAINTETQAIDFANTLRETLQDVLVIIVRRSDLVAQCGSMYRARMSGQWHAWRTPAGKKTKLTIPINEFVDYIRNDTAIARQLDLLDETHRVLHFDYESKIEAGSGWPDLFEFLGVEKLPVTWMQMRKVAPPPEEFIENCAELRQVLEQLPKPADSATRSIARLREKELAEQEHPYFLIHRAWFRLTEGLAEGKRAETARLDASDDLRFAFASKRPFDLAPATAGLACAALEQIGDAIDQGGADRRRSLHQEFGADPTFSLHLARNRARLGNLAAARDEVLKLLQRTPPDPEVLPGACSLLAHLNHELGSPPFAADQQIDNLIGHPSFELLQAKNAINAGDTKRARTHLLRCLTSNVRPDEPTLGEAFTLLEQAWNVIGDIELSRKDLEEVAQSHPGHAQCELARGWIEHRSGNHAAAEQHLLTALRNRSPWIEGRATALLGGVWHANKQWQRAAKALLDLSEQYSDSAFFQLLHAWTLLELGDSTGARQRAVALVGTDTICRYAGMAGRVSALASPRRGATADRSLALGLGKLTELHGSSTEFLTQRAHTLLKLGDPDGCRVDLLRAMNNPQALPAREHRWVFGMLGEALLQLADRDVAASTIRELRPHWHGIPAFHLLAGRTHAALGEHVQAADNLVDALLVQSTDLTTRNEAFSQLADWAVATNAPERLEQSLDRLATQHQDSRWLDLVRGGLAMRRGDLHQAETALLSALEGPRDHWLEGRAFGRLGSVWERIGDAGRALTHLERLAAIYDRSPHFLLRRAWLRLREREWRAAHDDALMALTAGQLAPDMAAWALRTLASAWEGIGEPELCLSTLATLRGSYGRMAAFVTLEAITLDRAGDRAGCITALRSALSLDPGYEPALRLQAQFAVKGT